MMMSYQEGAVPRSYLSTLLVCVAVGFCALQVLDMPTSVVIAVSTAVTMWMIGVGKGNEGVKVKRAYTP